MQTLTLKSPFDLHIHLRDGEMLENVIPYSAKYFMAALAMPNLNPPITNTQLALDYKQRILMAAQKHNITDFYPIMSLYLTSSLTYEELKKAKENGIFILKLYPKGSTTGSENGVQKILDSKILEILEIAQKLNMILSVHGESDGFVMDREIEFHPIFEALCENFPNLKIIFEHVSNAQSISLIEKYENLFGTLTLHHILLSLDDVIGGMLNPHYFCKPVLKTKKDQEALLQVALKAHAKFSFGSDSAPHLQHLKESPKIPAGIFNAPILLPALAQTFETHSALENLQDFVSFNASRIYNLPLGDKNITLIKKPMEIPKQCQGIIPMFAGETLTWSIE